MGIPIDGLLRPSESSTEAPVGGGTTQAATLKTVTTPAQSAINSMFDHIDEHWQAQGERVGAAGLPSVLDCVKPAPGISVSATYLTSNREQVQVTLTSYSAGMGAHVMDNMPRRVTSCKPAQSVVVYKTRDIGTSGRHWRISLSGQTVHVETFQFGDVLGHVVTTTENPAPARAVASVVNRYLSACVDTNSIPLHAYRNAVTSGKNFTGLTHDRTVDTRPVRVPALLGVEPVEPDVNPLDLPPQPTVKARDYPIWPDPPTPVKRPDAPVAPEPQQLTETVHIRVPDVSGPGCGWHWLATHRAPYDDEKVQAENQSIIRAAELRLSDDATRFEIETQDYWRDFASYRTAATRYLDYIAALNDARVQWERIDQDWATYRANYTTWQRSVERRDAFIAEQTRARADYERALVSCATPVPTPTPTPGDTEAGETPTPPSRPECPPKRPAILDRQPPEVHDEPREPANPRPQN